MMKDSNVDDASAANPGLGIPSWILLFVFSVVPAVFATGFAQFEVLKEGVLVGGVGLALVIWAGYVIARGGVSFVAGRVLVLGLAGALYVAASAGWSPGIVYGAVSASSIVVLIGIVVLISAPIGRPIRFVEFATSVSVGMGLAAMTGVLDLFGVGVFTLIWDPPGFTGAFDAMEFAVAFYAVTVPIAVAGTHYASGWQRLGFAVASALGALHFGLVANWTYLGLFAAACLVVALLILAYEGVETVLVLSPLGVMVGLVVLIKLVAGSFWAGPSDPTDATALPVLDRPGGVQEGALRDKEIRNPAFSIDRMESVRSMETRGYLTDVAFDLVQERPVFGHGAGAWWRLQTKYPNEGHPAVQEQFTYYPAFRSPHSMYAKLLVEYGPFGFALLVLWWLGCATIAVRALGRSGEHPDLIAEQWGLLAAVLGGLLFGLLTPLIELAPAAAVWFGSVAVLTRRSSEVNGFEGASERWDLGGDEGAPMSARIGVGAVAGGLAAAMVVLAALETVSRLHRGWGDHLMLRTYYERAIERYETADAWLSIHGGTVYNLALAQDRLGVLGEGGGESEGDETDEGEASSGGGDSDRKKERTKPGRREGASTGTEPDGDAEVGETAEASDRDERKPESDAGAVNEGRVDAGGESDAGDGEAPRESDEPEEAAEKKPKPKKKQKGKAGKGSDSGGTIPQTATAKMLASRGHDLLKRGVEMRPHDTRMLNLLANFYLRTDFGQKALDFARRAIAANPNSIPARETLATALRSVGKLEAAAKQLLAALDREPPDRYRYRLHFQLGSLYYRGLSEFQHAKEHYRAAQESARDRTRARRAKKKFEEVKKRIEHERKLREGELPEGTKPKKGVPPSEMPKPGKGPGGPPGEEGGGE